jgi:hypothetical protein
MSAGSNTFSRRAQGGEEVEELKDEAEDLAA